jgi:hypothetical protein
LIHIWRRHGLSGVDKPAAMMLDGCCQTAPPLAVLLKDVSILMEEVCAIEISLSTQKG